MKQVLSVLTALVILGFGTAEGANWVYLSSGSEGNVFFDSDSIISLDNDTLKVWTKAECTGAGGCRNPKGMHFKAKTLCRLNCRENILGVETSTYYDERDLVMEDTYTPVPVMKPVAPDTVNEALIKAVCPLKK